MDQNQEFDLENTMTVEITLKMTHSEAMNITRRPALLDGTDGQRASSSLINTARLEAQAKAWVTSLSQGEFELTVNARIVPLRLMDLLRNAYGKEIDTTTEVPQSYLDKHQKELIRFYESKMPRTGGDPAPQPKPARDKVSHLVPHTAPKAQSPIDPHSYHPFSSTNINSDVPARYMFQDEVIQWLRGDPDTEMRRKWE